MAILTNRPELLTPAAEDVLHIVDVSDNPPGTSKKIQFSNLIPAIPTFFGKDVARTTSGVVEDIFTISNGEGNDFILRYDTDTGLLIGAVDSGAISEGIVNFTYTLKKNGMADENVTPDGLSNDQLIIALNPAITYISEDGVQDNSLDLRTPTNMTAFLNIWISWSVSPVPTFFASVVIQGATPAISFDGSYRQTTILS